MEEEREMFRCAGERAKGFIGEWTEVKIREMGFFLIVLVLSRYSFIQKKRGNMSFAHVKKKLVLHLLS